MSTNTDPKINSNEDVVSDQVFSNVDSGTTVSSSTVGKRVLLVEDDPLIIKMYKAKFVHEGFEVLTAEDGVTGLEVSLNGRPDFIVLDIMMPQLSGLDLLEKLRQDPKGKDIPVIILTNLTEKEEEQRAISLGVKEYLLKANLTPGDIVEKVKKYLFT